MSTEHKEEDKKYSLAGIGLSALSGYFFGTLAASIEGAIGSLMIPSSLRDLTKDIHSNVRECFEDDGSAYDRLRQTVYHTIRIPMRLGIHATVLNNACIGLGEFLSNNSNGENSLRNYAWVLIPNALSLGYEIYRFGKERGKSSHKVEDTD